MVRSIQSAWVQDIDVSQARTCVGVAGLPFNALVEIECVAWR